MRSPTPHQYSELLTLPMGCCCSKPKIHPEIETRREVERRLRANVVYAPSILAVDKTCVSTSTPVTRFTFGETSKKPRSLLQDSSSSGEDAVIQLSPDSILKNNKVESKQKSHGLRYSTKVPKTKGFVFPPLHPVLGEPAAPSPGRQNKGTGTRIRKRQDQDPSPHRRPTDCLLYKKIEKGGDSSNENFHTGSNSDDDEESRRPPTPSGRKGHSRRTLEKKIIAIRRQNGSEEFFEQIYSKNNVTMRRPTSGEKSSVAFEENENQRRPTSGKKSSVAFEEIGNQRRPTSGKKSSVAFDENGNQRRPTSGKKSSVAFEENGNQRRPTFSKKSSVGFEGNGNQRRPTSDKKTSVAFEGNGNQRRPNPNTLRKRKALEQRLMDAYLAQSKSRIAPIIRVSSSTQNLERKRKPRRRILKKPWLMS